MEVFLKTRPDLHVLKGLLHACGGVSQSYRVKNGQVPSLLHACGGVSKTELLVTGDKMSSPRMWRCFQKRLVS